MLIGNINLDSLNIIKNQVSVTGQFTGFDEIFNELLKLLFENKDTSTNASADNTLFIFPFASFQNFLFQEIKNFQSAELSPEVKALLQSGQIDINELASLLQNLKSQNNKNEIQSLIEDFDGKILLNKENPNLYSSKLPEVVQNYSNKGHSEQLLFNSKLYSQGKLSEEFPSTFLLDIVKAYSESNGNNSEFPNAPLIKKVLNNEEISLPLNIFHSTQEKNNGIQYIQHKVDLPFTQLREVSDIVFKALSGSQKTIIVQLEPPELGKILIKLSMDNAGLRADMRVDYPHVKEALSALIPEIKNNLEATGLKVSDFLLDLKKDNHGYSDSYNGQGQRKYRGNHKFFEYFV